MQTDAKGTMVAQLMVNDGSAYVQWELQSDNGYWEQAGTGHEDQIASYRLLSRAYPYVLARGWWNKTPSMVNDGPNPGQYWRVVPDHDGWFALQNVEVTGLNLNVAGDGPYGPGTLILNYTWSGGQPNEVWKFIDGPTA